MMIKLHQDTTESLVNVLRNDHKYVHADYMEAMSNRIATLEAEAGRAEAAAYWRALSAVANTPDPFEMPDGDTFSTGINAAIFSISLLISNPGIDTLDMSKIWKALRDSKSSKLGTIDERLEAVQGYHEILAAFENRTAASQPETEAEALTEEQRLEEEQLYDDAMIKQRFHHD